MPVPKFDISLPDMHQELCNLLRQIPRNKVTTYGEIARALGSVRASRWVATHLNSKIDPDEFPAHRVIRSSGDLGTFHGGNIDLKRELILSDQIFIKNGIVDLQKYQFSNFQCDQPLIRLKQQQDKIQKIIQIKPFQGTSSVIGAVDVSYGPHDQSFATYALVDSKTEKLLWSKTVSLPRPFPYIPGFLAYRELPVYLKLIENVRKAKQLAPVTLVDGNGILHPQKAGIACQLGVYTNLKTIGVAKSLLCGTVTNKNVEQSSFVEYENEILGIALLPKQSRKPLYVSPGNGTDLQSSLSLVKRVMSKHRLPEPLYFADRISRSEATKSDS